MAISLIEFQVGDTKLERFLKFRLSEKNKNFEKIFHLQFDATE